MRINAPPQHTSLHTVADFLHEPRDGRTRGRRTASINGLSIACHFYTLVSLLFAAFLLSRLHSLAPPDYDYVGFVVGECSGGCLIESVTSTTYMYKDGITKPKRVCILCVALCVWFAGLYTSVSIRIERRTCPPSSTHQHTATKPCTHQYHASHTGYKQTKAHKVAVTLLLYSTHPSKKEEELERRDEGRGIHQQAEIRRTTENFFLYQ